MKESLPPPSIAAKRQLSRPRMALVALLVVCTFNLAMLFEAPIQKLYMDYLYQGSSSTPNCPQVDTLLPQKNADFLAKVGKIYDTKEFLNSAIEWLSGAVRVPTETFDSMGPVGEDERWENRANFHEYLLGAFPLVYVRFALRIALLC